MKITNRLLLFILGISITISCQNGKPVVVSTVQTINTDSVALTELVRNIYAWYEKKDKQFIDFEPFLKSPSDTFYSGIDMEKHKAILQSITESGLFSKKFIENYDSIASNMNAQLKSGEEMWLVGELPPFGYDANPWYDAQYIPEIPVNKIELENLVINKDTASFKIKYAFGILAKAKKENGTWKLSYLQGFNSNNFIPCTN